MRARAQALARWEGLLAALLALTLFLGFMLVPGFWSGQNFSLATAEVMEVGIMALAVTLVVMTGEIDISIASVLGLSSAVLGKLFHAGFPLGGAIAAVLVLGVVAGLVNGLLVTKLGLPSLVVTLGTLALYRGLCYVVLGDQQVSNWPTWFTDFGFGTVLGTAIPWPLVLFAVLAAVLGVVLHRSWLGRAIYAIGNNEGAARFSGIRVDRIKLGLFVLSGVFAALAGVVYTARLSSASPDNGVGLELEVVATVLLGGVSIFGGRGTLVGVVLALFLIGALTSMLGLQDVSGDVQNIVIGGLLIASVLGTNLFLRAREAGLRRSAARQAAEEAGATR
jgi:rhamnose transport system permease protein